jgi:hypothetical protein
MSCQVKRIGKCHIELARGIKQAMIDIFKHV